MIIRPINEIDLRSLVAIEESAQEVPWSEAAFLRCWDADYPGWGIEIDEKLVGFILMTLMVGECHIINLCIAPLYQKQGLGHQLLVHAMTWAKEQGAGIVYLEVRRSNLKAINLYRRMNFKLIGERRNYYPMPEGRREDALIFARDLGLMELV